MSLATIYRPDDWSSVVAQQSIVKVLEEQIKNNKLSNLYLLTGASGCGKTTIARIFGKKINNNTDSDIMEIDAASNNGVDNIRALQDIVKERSLTSKYKIIIIDEAHMITTAGWNAFLKCAEEMPKYTIIIMCTTNPEKIPATILNRTMRFNLTRLSRDQIVDRLKYICNNEKIICDDEALKYIANISNGGMRDAIANLEKCISYNKELNIDNVIECLGDFSYDVFFELSNLILDKKYSLIIKLIEYLYNNGNDLKLFIDQYFTFALNLVKYCLFKCVDMTDIPAQYKQNLDYVTDIQNQDTSNYFMKVADQILEIKNTIKNDTNYKTTICIMLLNIARR